MAADSRGYAGFNAPLGRKRKIRMLGDGTLIGCSTTLVGFSEAILDWHEGGAKKGEEPSAKELNFSLLKVLPDGRVFYGSDSLHLAGPLEADYFAIGSGMMAAYGALAMGASAERAVEIACENDVWSGLPVVQLRRRE